MSSRIATCSCGQLRAECRGEPIRVSVCHCLECKRRTGSAFSWNARFAAENVTISGASHGFARLGDEGSRITHRFCPDCGVTIAYGSSDLDGMIAVPAGCFADPGAPQPSVSVYHADSHRCGWLAILAEPLTICE